MYDILIKNGKVINGLNEVPYLADVAIEGDTIVKIGEIDEPAKKVIDAEGKYITPGFMDIHCHSDAMTFAEGKNWKRLRQGFTTEVVGNCGISAAPINAKNLELVKDYNRPFYSTIPVPYSWDSIAGYLEQVEKNGPLLNTATLVGHGTLRIAVAGFEDRALTREEQDKMNDLLRQSMEEGAYGFSSGLIYPPGVFANKEEITELAKVAAEYGGLYTTHMRSESIELVEAVTESIDIARQSGVSLEISHHKAHGIMNKNKSLQTLKLMHEAREEGLNVNCDVYAYTGCSTTAASYIPSWAHAGGVNALLERLEDKELRAKMIEDIKNSLEFENFYRYTGGWDKILLNECAVEEYQNKTVQEIADEKGVDPFEMALDIVKESKNRALMIAFTMHEEDVSRIIHDPLSMFCTDGIPSLGPMHPRYIGGFVRALEKYVKQDNILSLPEAIYKMTGLPAEKFGFDDRGRILEGMKADVLVIDYDHLHDNCDYVHYDEIADGMDYVIINGQVAVDAGEYKNICAGRVLRHTKK